MRAPCAAYAVLCLLALLPPLALGDVFTGKGQAVVINGDRAGAEKIALDVARADALGQAMERYVSSGAVDRHEFNLKKGELLRGDRSFVRGERLSDARYQKPLLQVQLQLDIDMQLLSRSLGLQGLGSREQLQARKAARPLTVVVVAEELNGAMNSFPYSTQVIQTSLLNADYPLVDSTAAARAGKHDQAVQAVFNNDAASARAIALQFDAGLMITGRAVVQKSAISAGGMHSYGANVALSAIATDTGRVLASSSADGNYPHVNAISGSRRAVEEAAAEAIADILDRLDQAEQGIASSLRLNVDGINYKQLAILKQLLQRDFSAIVRVDTLGFSGDIARLQIELAGPLVPFAEALAAKDFGSFRLRILSQSASKIDSAITLKN